FAATPPLCRQPSGATNAARWRTRSLLRDLCRKPYTGQLFTSGQKRLLDGDVRCRRVSGLSSLAIEIPAAHFRARVLADGQPTLGRDALLKVAGCGRAAHLRGSPSRIDRVREDVRPEAGDGEGQHDIEQF